MDFQDIHIDIFDCIGSFSKLRQTFRDGENTENEDYESGEEEDAPSNCRLDTILLIRVSRENTYAIRSEALKKQQNKSPKRKETSDQACNEQESFCVVLDLVRVGGENSREIVMMTEAWERVERRYRI